MRSAVSEERRTSVHAGVNLYILYFIVTLPDDENRLKYAPWLHLEREAYKRRSGHKRCVVNLRLSPATVDF
jgi:hypothetical protein